MSSTTRSILRAFTTLAGALLLFVALPQSTKQWLPASIPNPDFHFGLDLAGGTQLDFRISEDEMMEQLRLLDEEEATLAGRQDAADRLAEIALQRRILIEQQANVVEAIRTVLERRINSLGVSEATITPSYVGNEKHLLVECPGVVDVQKCIETVGKTIQLEFKEEFTEADEAFRKEVQQKVTAAQTRMKNGETLQHVGQDLGDELGMAYVEERQYFKEQLPKGLENLLQRRPGGVVRQEGSVKSQIQEENGVSTESEQPGIFLVEVTKPVSTGERTLNRADEAFPELARQETDLRYVSHKEERLSDRLPTSILAALRTLKAGELKSVGLLDNSARIIFLRLYTPGREEVEASHILVAYKDATQADPSVTRTKEEALTKAQNLKRQLDAGANFVTLARQESDGPSKANGGSLGRFGRGAMVPAFEQAAFGMAEGAVSDPVETAFGYHLIRVDAAATTSQDTANYDELVIPGPNGEMRGNAIIGKLQSGLVKKKEQVVTARMLYFSLKPSGWRDTPLDGKHFRSAAVSADPTTNLPIVQIQFDAEGGKLFQELTKRNVKKRIAIFVGGQLVSAPVVQQEITGGSAVITGSTNYDEARTLAQDLNTGAIPAPIHLTGQHTVEATLGNEALRTSVMAGALGIIIVMLYMFVVYRFLGLLANLSLVVYAVIFLAVFKLPLFLVTSQYMVLTLAGAAGLILSIGMAVDTNVLIFERIKEELERGKALKNAIELGFQKSWPSIRDSNVSTLITCGLLFLIGTSIVRGFAVTLGMGVIISMFTGITVTRWMCRAVARHPLSEKNPNLFKFGKQHNQAA